MKKLKSSTEFFHIKNSIRSEFNHLEAIITNIAIRRKIKDEDYDNIKTKIDIQILEKWS